MSFVKVRVGANGGPEGCLMHRRPNIFRAIAASPLVQRLLKSLDSGRLKEIRVEIGQKKKEETI